MSAPRALFCDLDGTIADSLGAMRVAYDAFLVAHGRAGSDDEFTALNGPSLEEIPLLLATHHGFDGEADALRTEYIAHVIAAYASVEPAADAAVVLDALAADGWQRAIVTANVDDVARSWLEVTGLVRHFDVIVTAKPGLRGKPEPDLYLEALRQTGCPAARGVALEDSKNGILAAQAAGLHTVCYAPSPERESWQKNLVCIGHMRDLAAALPRF